MLAVHKKTHVSTHVPQGDRVNAPLASVQSFDEDAWDELLDCSYLGQRGRREEAYTRLGSILRENEFEPPAASGG